MTLAATLSTMHQRCQEIWQQLETADPAVQAQLLDELWANQADQEETVDAIVELMLQIDAQIQGHQQQIDYYVQTHEGAIAQLKQQRDRITASIDRQYQCGVIPQRLVGTQHRISVRFNPASVDATQVDATTLPDRFRRSKTEYVVNKKALLAAYKANEPLPSGVHVFQRRKIEFGPISHLVDLAFQSPS